MVENNRLPVNRGDDLDMQPFQSAEVLDPTKNRDLAGLLENPENLARTLGVNAEQAKNIRSAIIGAGTGYIHNKLSPYFGDDIAAAIGALGTSYLSRKIIDIMRK